MRAHKFNLAFVAIIFLFFCLACSFKFGDADGNSNAEISRRKDSSNGKIENRKNDAKKEKSEKDNPISRPSQTDSAQKLGGYHYQRLDYSLYLIPKNSSKEELIEIARDLHEQEPKTILLLVDDDRDAEQFIAYHRQLEDFHEQPGAEKPETEYPHDWANSHIVGTVNLFLESGERNWYLVEGGSLSDKKISKLE